MKRFHRFSIRTIIKEIKNLNNPPGLHHSISVTGGEPLSYADVLNNLLPLLKRTGLKVYLETNGTLPGILDKVIKDIDFIAMDIKLPSSTKGDGFWKEHLEFLKIAWQKKVFVKVVITPGTTSSDMQRAVSLIKEIDYRIPLCIQPATSGRGVKSLVSGKRLLEFQKDALKELKDVRLIPQIHKVLRLK